MVVAALHTAHVHELDTALQEGRPGSRDKWPEAVVECLTWHQVGCSKTDC